MSYAAYRRSTAAAAAAIPDRTVFEFDFLDMRGAGEHTTCEWSVALRAAGGTDDGRESCADDVPAMVLRATASELETIVRRMVAYGLFGPREFVRPGGAVARWCADTVYVTAVRLS